MIYVADVGLLSYAEWNSPPPLTQLDTNMDEGHVPSVYGSFLNKIFILVAPKCDFKHFTLLLKKMVDHMSRENLICISKLAGN